MREGWTYKKLGEIGDIITGSTPSTKHIDNYNSNDVCFVKPSDIPKEGIGLLSDSDFYISSKAYQNSRKLPIGSVLTTCIGIIGKVGILNVNATCNQQINAIIPYPNVSSSFLAYTILSKRHYLEHIANAPVVPIINKKEFSNTIIPVPPLSEQQCIVSELDLLSSIIDKKKSQLKEYDQLAQSIFLDMFGDPVTNEKGWEVKKLGEVAKEKLSYGSGASAIPYDNEIRYVRITDIKDDGELNCDMVSPNTYDDKYLLNDGDILFARSGATVGKTFLYKEKYGKCIYAGYLIRLIPNTKIVIPSYVYGFTKSPYYRSFVAKAQNAVAQPNINAKQYSELSIPLPPLSLQQSFASKIEAIERQKALVQQSITETETLFNSRMDYWFS